MIDQDCTKLKEKNPNEMNHLGYKLFI